MAPKGEEGGEHSIKVICDCANLGGQFGKLGGGEGSCFPFRCKGHEESTELLEFSTSMLLGCLTMSPSGWVGVGKLGCTGGDSWGIPRPRCSGLLFSKGFNSGSPTGPLIAPSTPQLRLTVRVAHLATHRNQSARDGSCYCTPTSLCGYWVQYRVPNHVWGCTS